MTKEQKKFINEHLYRRMLVLVPDSIDAGDIANALQDDVISDIEETADPEHWHSGDIDVALARVLKKRLLNN